MSRRKQASIFVPATDADALVVIGAYVGEARRLRAIAEHADKRIAAIEQQRDADIAAAMPLQDERFAALKAWWEAGGSARLTSGKKRSAELAGASVGIRTAPASVRLPKGLKAQALVKWLLGLRWARKSRFIRVKHELNKDALIAAWPKEPGTRKMFGKMGVDVAGSDDFFIDVGPAETTAKPE